MISQRPHRSVFSSLRHLRATHVHTNAFHMVSVVVAASVVPVAMGASWLVSEELLVVLVPLEGVETGTAFVLIVTTKVHIVSLESHAGHVQFSDAHPAGATCGRGHLVVCLTDLAPAHLSLFCPYTLASSSWLYLTSTSDYFTIYSLFPFLVHILHLLNDHMLF